MARSELLLIHIFALESCHSDAYAVVSDVARNAAVMAMETYGTAPAVLTDRHAEETVMTNASCMLIGLVPAR